MKECSRNKPTDVKQIAFERQVENSYRFRKYRKGRGSNLKSLDASLSCIYDYRLYSALVKSENVEKLQRISKWLQLRTVNPSSSELIQVNYHLIGWKEKGHSINSKSPTSWLVNYSEFMRHISLKSFEGSAHQNLKNLKVVHDKRKQFLNKILRT